MFVAQFPPATMATHTVSAPLPQNMSSVPTPMVAAVTAPTSSSNASFPPATMPAHTVAAPLAPPLAQNMSSVPTPTVAAVTAPTLSSNDMSACLMYKALLNEHLQKASLPAATFTTVNEGSAHLPRFRATALVGEERFTSPNVFLHRKEAEHDAARVAWESLRTRTTTTTEINEEDFSLIHEGTVFCKSILYEYAVKRQLEMPVYNTVTAPGHPPIFLSSLVLSGVTYVGKNSRTKKEAEQLAARAVLLALIGGGDPLTRTILSKIISSKKNMYSALLKNNSLQNAGSSMGPMGNDNVPIVAMPQPAQEGTRPPIAPVLTPVQQAPNVPHHVFSVQKGEAVQERIELPITFVPPNVGQSAAAGAGPRSYAKRKNSRKRAAKRMRMEAAALQQGMNPPNAVVLTSVE